MNTDNLPSFSSTSSTSSISKTSTTSNPNYSAVTASTDFPSKGCSTCRFFESFEYSDSGICHRYPHPEVVNTTHWCGEWQSLHGMFSTK